jgi:glycine oxidase
MRGADIVVAGAGAIGSAIACGLARAGHRVTVVDPMAANASSVAAGMLAPAFESLFDPVAAGGYALLAEARDAWPALAAQIGLPLASDGALAIGSQAEAAAWADQLSALGARATLLTPANLADVAPGAPAGAWAAFTPDDWRLEPGAALARLRAAAEQHGAHFMRGRVTGFAAGQARLESGAQLRADRLVIATGADRALAVLAPELATLTPIKGHILRAESGLSPAAVVRAAGLYLCRGEREAVIGATMEVGADDATVDPEVVTGLLERAATLVGLLAQRDAAPPSPSASSDGWTIVRSTAISWSAAAGVRAATPDGLPLVGAAGASGVILAVGARRNGWLLAPMIARGVLDAVEGRAPSAPAAAFDPRRLAPSSRPG